MTVAIPKGVSERRFKKAFEKFAGVVGNEWASYAEEEARAYNDPYYPGDLSDYQAAGFVAPASVEEVQAIVRLANDYKIPLWPISTGKNLAYGGAAPAMPGTVTLDLKRMNRILEVNEELAYAVVEPGVSFFDLHKYLQDNDIKLWTSVPGPGWGSVLGNALERGVGYGYYSEHFEAACGMEVVLPNGELLRTGMGAMGNSNSWHNYRAGFGPSMDGLFAQSNFGVVTKMGRFLQPRPEGYRYCTIGCKTDEQMPELINRFRPFKLDGTINTPITVTHSNLMAAFTSQREKWYQGEGPIPEEVTKKIEETFKMPRWTGEFALTGRDAEIEQQWQVIKAAFGGMDDIVADSVHYRPSEQTPFHPRHRILSSIPGLEEFNLVNWRGAGGHIDFSPVGPLTGEHAKTLYEMVNGALNEFGFELLGGFFCGDRFMRMVNTLVFDKTSPEEMSRVRELFRVLIDRLAAKGYGEYRTHLAYMDQVAGSYDFNDNIMLKTQEQLKETLDPNGIIAPGKSGIWPEKYKGKGNSQA